MISLLRPLNYSKIIQNGWIVKETGLAVALPIKTYELVVNNISCLTVSLAASKYLCWRKKKKMSNWKHGVSSGDAS